MRQYAVIVAVVVPLSCEYVLHQRPRGLVLLVVVLDVVVSNPIAHPSGLSTELPVLYRQSCVVTVLSMASGCDSRLLGAARAWLRSARAP